MRYNIFNTVHLPFKTGLITTCISISNAIKGEVPVAEALKKVEEVLHTFDQQISYEALHILPFVFEYEEGIWNNYTSEHYKAARLSNKLKELVHAYQKQKNEEDRLKMLQVISKHHNEYMLFNFNHMDDEEAVLNEILWRYYQDEVLKQIEEKLDILPHLVNRQEQGRGFQIAA